MDSVYPCSFGYGKCVFLSEEERLRRCPGAQQAKALYQKWHGEQAEKNQSEPAEWLGEGHLDIID